MAAGAAATAMAQAPPAMPLLATGGSLYQMNAQCGWLGHA